MERYPLDFIIFFFYIVYLQFFCFKNETIQFYYSIASYKYIKPHGHTHLPTTQLFWLKKGNINAFVL